MRVIRKAERDRNSHGTQSMPGPCRLYLHQPWILSSLCCCFSALSVLSLQPDGAYLFHSTYKGFMDQRIREALIRLPREKVIAPFSPINTDSSHNALHDGYLNIRFMSIFFFFDHVAWVHRPLFWLNWICLWYIFSSEMLSWIWKNHWGTSLVVQGLRIHLPMQRTRVQSLAQEDAASRRAAKPALLNPSSRGREPQLLQPVCWSPGPAAGEATSVRRPHTASRE